LSVDPSSNLSTPIIHLSNVICMEGPLFFNLNMTSVLQNKFYTVCLMGRTIYFYLNTFNVLRLLSSSWKLLIEISLTKLAYEHELRHGHGHRHGHGQHGHGLSHRHKLYPCPCISSYSCSYVNFAMLVSTKFFNIPLTCYQWIIFNAWIAVFTASVSAFNTYFLR
jgi:hypothetical protein